MTRNQAKGPRIVHETDVRIRFRWNRLLDPALRPDEIALKRVDNAGLDSVMTNSFGFGGTNGSMILSRYLD